MKTTHLALLLAALGCASCFVINLDFSYDVKPDPTGGGSSSSGGGICTPSATQACYSGPAGTVGQGICKAGSQTCAADGASWGPCVGEVLPQVEDCATPQDENCDGLSPACTGVVEWAKRFGGSGNQTVYGVAADAAGNVVVVGQFAGTVDFGGGPLTSAGGQDIFVAKLDPNGGHLWSKRYGDAAEQFGASVAVDDGGNVVVVGYFAGAVDFGGGPLPSAGGQDIFVAKLDPGGAHLWSQRFGDASDQHGTHVAVDGSGNVVVTGSMAGSVDFGGGPLTSAGSNDVFVVKLDPGGGHVWSERFGGAGDESASGVAVDAAGDVALTGHFTAAIDFGGGPLVSAGVTDIFLAKLDAAGGHVWSKRYGDASDQTATSVAMDPSGAVVFTGTYKDADLGGGPLPGVGSIFLAKVDAAGNHLWSKKFGDLGNQGGTGVAVDFGGNVLLTGYLQGSADFGGGPLPSAGKDDIFVAKFSAGGAHVWSKRFGDTDDQQGRAVTADGSGNVILAANVRGSVDFGTGALPDGGSVDLAVARLSP
jgi:hypothetical protein